MNPTLIKWRIGLLVCSLVCVPAAGMGDLVHLDDGSVMKGRVERVLKDEVILTSEKGFEVIDRGRITAIEYDDGSRVEMREEEGAARPAVAWKHFMDARLRVAGFFTCAKPHGGIFDREKRVLNLFRPDLTMAYLNRRDFELSNIAIGGGGEAEFFIGRVKRSGGGRFDFRGIKAGVRARYLFTYIDSAVVDEDKYFITVEGYELFSGRIMISHTVSAGPSVSFVFGPRDDRFNLIVPIALTAGPLFGGRLRAAAAIRSCRALTWELGGLLGQPFLAPEVIGLAWLKHRTSFKGYTLRLQVGPHIALNQNVPFDVGVDVMYAMNAITLVGRIPIYGGWGKKNQHDVGIEVSAGIHLEPYNP